MRLTKLSTRFGTLLQQFFIERLMQQQHASARTIAAYRDCFRLLLAFAERRLGKRPAEITVEDLNAPLVLEFLEYVEKQRHNTIRSRNARFAAIRSFMHYAGLKEPAVLATTQSVLAIPMKRFERPLVGFLSRKHIEAIIAGSDLSTSSGRRDHVMLATLYNTGARVSELIGMRIGDLILESTAFVRIHGKGRKERTVPLWPATAAQLRRWLRERPRAPEAPLFPNRSGGQLTRTSVTERLALAARSAARLHPELTARRVSPHLFRHSLAMHLLQAGVDITVIALWLGHESPATTHMYVEADLAMKERALKRIQPPRSTSLRYRPSDRVMQFLESL